MKYKILFVMTQAFNPTNGGVQNTTFKLGREFSKRGHQVNYYSFKPEGHIDVEFGTLYKANEKGSQWNKKNNETLTELIRTLQPQFVINQTVYEKNIHDAVLLAKKEVNFIFLGCLRNSLFSVVNNLQTYAMQILPKRLHFMSNSKIIQRILLAYHRIRHTKDLARIIKNHDYFVLLAPTNIDELDYFLKQYDKRKIVYVPNSIPGVNGDLTKKEKIILHVGRLNFSQKRSDLIIPFWEKLHTLLPDWSFEIVGYGEYEKKIVDEIEKKNLPRVKFFGKQKPNDFYSRASIFMMPSAYEGFANTLIEAQSFGCVPFCFDSYPAINWIVNNGKDAFLVDPFDIDRMAVDVAAMAADKSALEINARNAIKNAERFTAEVVTNQWEKLFNDLSVK